MPKVQFLQDCTIADDPNRPERVPAGTIREITDGLATFLIERGVVRLVEESVAPEEAPRQSGGPVEPGSFYPVGEPGPEMFFPNMEGRVVPVSEENKIVTPSETKDEQEDDVPEEAPKRRLRR